MKSLRIMGDYGSRMTGKDRWGRTGLSGLKLEYLDLIRVGPPRIGTGGLSAGSDGS
jgi:hypothetical protein